MKLSPKLVKIMVVALLPIGGAGVALALTHVGGLPDNAAFKVDGKVVTTTQLDHQAGLLQALYGIQKPASAKEQSTYRRDIAKAVAVGMVLDKAASDKGIVVPDKSARDTLATMVDKQLGANGESQFTALLGKYGVTEADVLTEIKRQQSIARLFQDITKPMVTAVTDDDARQAFEADPGKFATPEQRTLRNIVVATKQQAAKLAARLARGADFAQLAKQSSLDDATRAKGGSLGKVTADQLDPAYAKVAFGTALHGVFGPVKTQYGWNVGQVVAISPGHQPTYAEVRADVEDAVRSDRAMTAWRGWITDRIREAHVEYADAYRPADPDAAPPGLGVPTAGTP